MKQCPKTLNGEHEFKDNTKEANHPLRDIHGNYVDYPICRFCGAIDTGGKND